MRRSLHPLLEFKINSTNIRWALALVLSQEHQSCMWFLSVICVFIAVVNPFHLAGVLIFLKVCRGKIRGLRCVCIMF